MGQQLKSYGKLIILFLFLPLFVTIARAQNSKALKFGAVQLLPALPDAWQGQDSVSGLKVIGGFEIVQMEWKDGKVVEPVIKSNLGGNLRLRVPNKLKLTGGILKDASGENINPFYQLAATKDPIISPKVTASTPELKFFFSYDVLTMAGKPYSLVKNDQ